MSTFNYTSRDYATIREDLFNRASISIPEWTDSDPSDFMNALIDMWAYAADILHFYIDRAAGEAFLSTATQRDSVLAMANLYDYTPTFVASARAGVDVYLQPTAASVAVAPSTEFQAIVDSKAITYYALTGASVNPGETARIEVREGTSYTNQAVTSSTGTTFSSGRASQRFNLYHTGIDPTTIRVYVTEGPDQSPVEWRRVSNLATSSATDSVYSVYVASNGITQIVFGNGVNGRIPPNNITITTDYVVSSGNAGNLPENAITTIVGNNYPGLSVVGSTLSFGGQDPESIASIKAALPKSFRTLNRAVTLSDFSDLALSVEGVSKATAAYAAVSGTGGSVSIYVVPPQSGYTQASPSGGTIEVSTELRTRVQDEVLPKTMLGVATVAVPAEVTITPIFIGVDVYVRDNYIRSQVQQAVSKAIDGLLSFDQVSFGQTLTVGEFYRAALAIEGVDYLVITQFNTTGTPNSIVASGKIQVNAYQLPKKGGVAINTIGGVAPPV